MPRNRIHRVRTVTIGQLDAEQRAEIGPRLTEIIQRSFDFPHPEVLAERVIFRDPDAELKLLYDEDDEILGFLSRGVSRVQIDGVEHAVIDMGMYVEPGVRGAGELSVRWACATAIGLKLRQPSLKVWYVGEMTSPVAYRRTLQCPVVYPRRGVETPPEVERLTAEIMARRNMSPVNGDVWRVNVGLPFGFQDPERMRDHVRESNDPDMDFYLARNPGYLRGDWLVVAVPLEPRHLLATALPQLRRWVGNTPRPELSPTRASA